MNSNQPVLNQLILLEGHLLAQNEEDAALLLALRRRRRRNRSCWTKPWLTLDNRLSLGQYHQLMQQLRVSDMASFENYIRMASGMFHELLVLFGEDVIGLPAVL